MGKYVLAYLGGTMSETEEARATVIAAWGAWLGSLGEAVLDGGNPFMASASVAGDGSVSDGASSGLRGYSILKSDSLAAASDLAKGCPIFAGGGSVDVYEAREM